MCNCTRLLVKRLMPNLLEATVVTGCAKGEDVFTPRIPVIPSDLAFTFKRIQFPVKLSFAMSLNKAQGHTSKVPGIDLQSPCFSLRGASSSNTNEMQGLANKCTGGDMTQLVNSMNDFFVSVSADLPRLDPTHRIFDIEEPLPAEFTIEAASTQSALQKVKCRKATGTTSLRFIETSKKSPTDLYHY